jgi:hypothetical protein
MGYDAIAEVVGLDSPCGHGVKKTAVASSAEPDYGAQRQHLVHGIFYRVVRGFTEDRKYLTDLLSPGLFQTCTRKPFGDRVQE